MDVFHPNTGEVRSDGADGIACWFIDTDYNEESFFVRHAYFLGANDPYKALKITLKAEIDPDAWATLHSDISRPFDRPESGRHRRQGHQPPRRRGDESVPGVSGRVPITRRASARRASSAGGGRVRHGKLHEVMAKRRARPRAGAPTSSAG